MSDGTIGTLLIIGSVFFDVFANICLKKSQGFKYKLYGFLAISLVGFAFFMFSLRYQHHGFKHCLCLIWCLWFTFNHNY